MSCSRTPSMLVAAWAAMGMSCSVDSDPHSPSHPDDQPVVDETERVFDTSVLHEIRIEVAPEHLYALENDRENRVPCRFTFDGVTLDDVGIRMKGSGSQSGSLHSKPSFSIKFNEFIKGQKLHGVNKLLLNSARFDPTLVHEHLGFDLYGRAGFPHRRTAHAVVTFAGLGQTERVYGVHVMVEPVNRTFLTRHFGEEYDHGNLFEDENAGDFAGHPRAMDLKDENEPGRSYERLVKFADFLNDTPDMEFVERIEEFIDLEQALDSFALDLIAQHGDGFWHAAHNYYMYQHPADRRFYFIAHGMDLLFGPTGPCGEVPVAVDLPTTLGERIARHPALRNSLDAAIERMLDAVWDEDYLEARIRAVGELLEASSHDEPEFIEDLEEYRASHAELIRIVRDAKTVWRKPDNDGVCGDGILNGRELCAYACDDGNLIDGDGCSAECLVEYCGDGIVQPDLGEVCDGEDNCEGQCTRLEIRDDDPEEASGIVHDHDRLPRRVL